MISNLTLLLLKRAKKFKKLNSKRMKENKWNDKEFIKNSKQIIIKAVISIFEYFKFVF